MSCFTWRAIRFTPDPHDSTGYRSEAVHLTAERSADWKVGKARGSSTWFARLRVGADRFPGRGETASQALDAAAAEARLVLRLMKVALDRTDQIRGTFTWRGLIFRPVPALPGFWRTELMTLSSPDGRAERSADWKVQQLKSATWHARLRVGADRFPGRGESPEQALDAAAAEARPVLRLMKVALDRTDQRPRAEAKRKAGK